MKKKSILFLVLLILVLTFSLTLSACIYTGDAVKVKFTIDDKVEATIEVGEGASNPTITPKEGYTLSKWYFDKEYSEEFSFEKLKEKGLEGEISVYAKWIPNEYIISFEENGGTSVDDITADFGAVVTKPSDPTKVGYTFGGWFTDNGTFVNEFVFNTMSLNGATVYAKWNTISYNISYSLDGGTNNELNPDAYTIEDEITFASPTKLGYTFVGWFDSAVGGTQITKIALGSTGDKTIYARWDINQYTISFEENGGTSVDDITADFGAVVTKPSDPTKVGYTFGGWFTDNSTFANEFVFSTMPLDGVTVYAKWIVNGYTITFEENGGSTVDDIIADFGASVTKPADPTKDGHTFGGWFTDNSAFTNEFTFSIMPLDGTTVYAKWDTISYSISYSLDGGTNNESNSDTYTIEDEITFVSPTKLGYTFWGWFDSEIDGTQITEIALGSTGNKTLYARWSINQYTITFEENGGSIIEVITADFGASITNPTDPTRAGYTFGGWFTDNETFLNAFIFDTMPLDGATVYAKWIVNGYTITLEENGGSTVDDIIADFGASVTKPIDPTRAGYTFGGWFTDNNTFVNEFVFGTMPLNGATVYTKWETIFYNISYNLDGGTNNESNPDTYTIEDGITFASPTKLGYTFAGWFDSKINGSQITEIILGSMGDKTLYARWSINQYTIQFEENGGSYIEDITLDYDAVVIKPADPTRVGYTFGGWFADNNTFVNEFIFGTMPLDGATVYAKWNVNQYTITFEENGGSFITDITTDFKAIITEPESPIREGYTFVGWYTDNDIFANEFIFDTMPLNGAIIYAKWVTFGLSYTYNSAVYGYVVKKGVANTNGAIIIASTYDDGINGSKRVKRIGDNAFKDCLGLSSITIPSSVISIGTSAFSGCRTLARINLPEGVTSIGERTFYNCSGLTSITIPEGVTSIGSSAFSYCRSLTSITIPNSVTSIGSYAFEDCSSLTSITIPNSVTSIGSDAFNGCSSLTSVTIGNSVTSIGNSAFRDCSSLTSITVASGNTTYHSAGNCLIETATKKLILGCKNSVIPADGSVTSITDNGFLGCSGLVSISIPNSVTSIGNSAFHGCSSLTSITISSSVTYIGSYAFAYCSSLTSVTIPDSVTSIGSYAFSGCSGLTSVTIGNGVTSIGNYAFHGCSSLTSVTIGNSVTSIGFYAFHGCSSLTIYTEVVSMPSGWNSSWNSSNCPVVWDCNNSEIAADGNIYYISDNGIRYALKDGVATVVRQSTTLGGDIEISSIIAYKGISYTVTCIGNGAFKDCKGLTSIFIPDSVTSIGSEAFSVCSSLTSIIIPNGVTSIGFYAFSNCSGLTSITIPNSVTSIGFSAFNETGIWNHAADNSVVYADKWAVGYKGTIMKITLNSDTVGIGNSAFSKCNSLTSVTIGNSVTSIGSHAFSVCSSLTSITIGNSVTSIGNGAFEDCKGLTSIVIPDSVTSIGERAFEGCSSLTSVAIGSSVTNIGDYAFNRCSLLASITIPNSVTSIGNGAFYDCSSLTSIVIPDGVTSIGNGAFYDCSSLTSIVIPDGVTSIGNGAFYDCSSLTSIVIPDGVTSIGNGAFLGCSSLTSINMPEGVTSIGSDAFLGCSSLTSIVIPDGVTSIGNGAFQGCSSLTSIVIPDSVISIGDAAFSGCRSLTSVTIGNSVTSIGSSAFSGCSSLTSITIPNSVTSIGGSAFSVCSGLTSIVVASGNTKYHSEGNCLIETATKTLIAGCKTSIIPTDGSVTSIGSSVFSGCSGLTSIIIPASVTRIGSEAFAYCSALTSIKYYGTIAQWKKITKYNDWNNGTGAYTVDCNDGNITHN